MPFLGFGKKEKEEEQNSILEQDPNNILLENIFSYNTRIVKIPTELLKRFLQIYNKNYSLIDFVSAGGEGIILAVKDQNTQQKICLKIINPIYTKPNVKVGGCYFKERFHNSILTQKELNKLSNNSKTLVIPRVFRLEKEPFLVLEQEFIEGSLIIPYLASKKNIIFSLRVFIQLLTVINKYIHNNNIIHRDLKSLNIMITGKYEAEPIISILDWTLSKNLNENLDLTRVGEGLGTPIYASPKQLAEKNAVNSSFKDDIYSLGYILWEFLQWRSLPKTIAPNEVYNLNSIIRYNKELADFLPLKVRNIFYKMICQDEKIRYNSLDLIINDLSIILEEWEKEENTEQLIPHNVVDTELSLKTLSFDLCSTCEYSNDICSKFKLCNLLVNCIQGLKNDGFL
jgi:serine/threonine protein kinase